MLCSTNPWFPQQTLLRWLNTVRRRCSSLSLAGTMRHVRGARDCRDREPVWGNAVWALYIKAQSSMDPVRVRPMPIC